MYTIPKVSEIRTTQLIEELMGDQERKSLLRIFSELFYLLIRYRTLPTYYFSRYLFKKEINTITDYLPNKFLYKIKSRFNKRHAGHVLDNKLFFDFYYRQINFNLPELWMYNDHNAFVINRESFEVHSIDDFKNVIERIIRTYSSDNTVFIKKTYNSYAGAHIHKIHLDQLTTLPEIIRKIYSDVINSSFIFQQTVSQHHELRRLNPYCLNTMRFDTFINLDGTIEIISGYLKTNLRNNHVDNEPTGGCEISIDLETGKLMKYGHMTLKFNGLSRPTHHPTTMTVFENFMIPYFNESKEIVIQAASKVQGLRLIGWDVAIGENGPVLIEGNSDYDIAASDLAYGGYRANPVFRKILKEINYL